MRAPYTNIQRAKIVLYAIGLAIAIYLIIAEPSRLNSFSTSLLLCPDQGAFGIVNCSAVLTSKYSYVFGAPLADLAAAWFVILLMLSIFQRHHMLIGMLSAYLNIAGIFAVAYSAYSMYMLGKVCIYCSSIDVILIILLALGIAEARALLRSLS